METVYLVCAIVGGTLVACQFVLTLLGIGDGHGDSFDGGHHLDLAHGDHGHAGDAGHDSSWFFGVLSFRALSASVAFFGLAGMAASRQMDPGLAVLVAALTGVAGLFLVAWMLRQMMRLNVDGTVYIDRAVGSRGSVYLNIPGGKSGAGKVHVSLHGRTLEYKAVTASDPLPTGTPIQVVAIVGPDTVEVTPVHSEKEVPAHG